MRAGPASFFAACALVSVSFAGCLAGSGERVAPASAPRPNSIAGQVVDEAFVPLAGANVSVRGWNASALSDREGRFRFSGVPDGEFLILAAKPGYRSGVSRAAVAGGETRVVTVSLVAIPVAVASHESVEKRGYVSCAVAVRTGAGGGAGSHVASCGARDPNDAPSLAFDVPPGGEVAGIVLELAWSARSPGARALAFSAWQPLSSGDARPLGGTSGQGYAAILVPQSVAREAFASGGSVRTLVEPSGSFLDDESPTDAAVVVQQDFTVFATVFLNAPPPPGWSVFAEKPHA